MRGPKSNTILSRIAGIVMALSLIIQPFGSTMIYAEAVKAQEIVQETTEEAEELYDVDSTEKSVSEKTAKNESDLTELSSMALENEQNDDAAEEETTSESMDASRKNALNDLILFHREDTWAEGDETASRLYPNMPQSYSAQPRAAALEVSALITQLLNRVGAGYSQDNRLGPDYYDCSGLLYTSFQAIGITNAPLTTAAWDSLCQGLSIGDIVEFSGEGGSLYFQLTAKNIEILTNQAKVQKAGTIMVMMEPGETSGHVAVSVGSVARQDGGLYPQTDAAQIVKQTEEYLINRLVSLYGVSANLLRGNNRIYGRPNVWSDSDHLGSDMNLGDRFSGPLCSVYRVDALNTTFGVSVNNLTTGKSGSNVKYVLEPTNEPPKTGNVEFQKQGVHTGETAIPNARFAIYSDAVCTDQVTEFQTDANGHAKVSLNAGTYYCKELEAPDGFRIDPDKIWIVSVAAGDSIEQQLEEEEWRTALSLKKIDDETDKTISGAVFELQEWSEKNSDYAAVGQLTEQSTGTFTVSEYTIRSTGSRVSDGNIYYTTDNQGKFRLLETKSPDGFEGNWSQEVTLTGNNQDITLTASNTPFRGKVQVRKVDALTQKPIVGVTFMLQEWSQYYERYINRGELKYTGDGYYTVDSYTDISSEIIFNDGYLHYKPDNKGKFRIEETDSTTNYSGNWSQEFVITQAIQEFSYTAENTPNDAAVTVRKTDAVTGETVSGATFTLYQWSNYLDRYITVGTLEEQAGDNAGIYVVTSYKDVASENVFSDGKLYYTSDSAGRYKIVETVLPAGYVGTGWSQEFTITKSSQSFSYEAKNQPGSVRLEVIKVEKDSNIPLSGAIFSLEEWSVSQNDYKHSGYLTDMGDGTYCLESYTIRGSSMVMDDGNLYYSADNSGRFRLIETQAPEGYAGNWSMEFSIMDHLEDGTICYTVENIPDGAGSPITVAKRDSVTGQSLTGAGFSLQEWSKLSGNYIQVSTLSDQGDGTYTLVSYTDRRTGKEITDGNLYRTADNEGKFKIVETKVPEGYTGSWSQEFTITNETQDFRFTADNVPFSGGPIEITKLETGTEIRLTGVVFSLQEWSEKEGNYTEVGTLADHGDGTYHSFSYTARSSHQKIEDGNLYYSPDNQGKFRIVELQAPQGYDGNWTQELIVSAETPKLTFTAENRKMTGKLALQKEDNNGTCLQGAEFTVYSDEKAENTIAVITTGDDGIASIELPIGNYYVKETKTPDGFKEDGTIYGPFTVEDDDEKNPVHKIINYPADGSIRLQKSGTVADGTTVALAGAVFGVYDSKAAAEAGRTDNQDTAAAVLVTDDNGIAVTEKLKAGQYWLKELQAPDGYELDLTIYGGEAGYRVGWTETTVLVSCVNTPKKGRLTLHKEGLDESGAMVSLEGAVFGVYLSMEDAQAATGDKPLTDILLVTDTDGKATTPELPCDEYYVKELSAPEGYVLDTTIYGAYTVGLTNAVVTVPIKANQPAAGVLLIKKIDSVTKNGLSGAIYTVYSDEACTKKAGELIVKDDSARLQLPYGIYWIKETTVPHGYLLDETVYGPYHVGGPNGDANIGQIEETEQHVEIVLDKRDTETGMQTQGDATLEGAVFALYAAENIVHPDGTTGVVYHKGDFVASLTTDASGHAFTRTDAKGQPLHCGSYMLRETKAPRGYALDQETIYPIDAAYDENQIKLEYVTYNAGEIADQIIKQPVLLHKYKNNQMREEDELEGIGFMFYPLKEVLERNNADSLADLPTNADGLDLSQIGLEGIAAVIGESQETELFTDVHGKLQTIPLIYGDYLVIESTANRYYKACSPFVITVPTVQEDNADGETADIHDIDFIPAFPMEIPVINWPATALLQIEKLDTETGLRIRQANAAFQILDAAGKPIFQYAGEGEQGTAVDIFYTNEEGYLRTYQPLEAGEYTLVEVAAPAGFVKGASIHITIDTNGVYYEKEGTRYRCETGIAFEGETVAIVSVENKPTTVEISKTDVVTGREIAGAHLSIYHRGEDGSKGELAIFYDTEGNEVPAAWTTDGSKHTIQRIPAGLYWLEEEQAPIEQGYVKAEMVAFEVLETGEIQRVEMKDDFTRVNISKTDFVTGQPVAGAELILRNGDGREVARWTTGADADGITLDHLAPGNYTLTEILAPDGYATAESVSIVVKEVGGHAEIQKVEMKDRPIQLEIIKLDAMTKQGLAGARLQVLDQNKTVIEEWISTETAHQIWRLPCGEYLLHEAEAPEGYEPADDVPFIVFDTEEIQQIVMFDTPSQGKIISTPREDEEDEEQQYEEPQEEKRPQSVMTPILGIEDTGTLCGILLLALGIILFGVVMYKAVQRRRQ